MNDLLQKETKIVQVLRTIYDPEIPVNIYDLGLIYEIDVDEEDFVTIKMTLTAPNCPVADDLLNDVREVVGSVEGVRGVAVNLVFDPPWTRDMISEEALLELGLL
jgi:FeS assembly SUF system protein